MRLSTFFPTILAMGFLTGSALADTPPTILTAATANPSSVVGTGKVCTLKVLAADDLGEAKLVYTWSATGPATVSFSINKSNAAKTTKATFSKGGSYNMIAVAKDSLGQNSPWQLFRSYLKIWSGDIWWTRFSDGRPNTETELDNDYKGWFLSNDNRYSRNPELLLSDGSLKKRQVAVTEFRITPKSADLIIEYTTDVHCYNGYGLDIRIDRTGVNVPGESLTGEQRCGCGSFVGLTTRYAGIADVSRWLKTLPMPEVDMGVGPRSWLQLAAYIEDYRFGRNWPIIWFFTDVKSRIDNKISDYNRQSGNDFLACWGRECPASANLSAYKGLRLLSYDDPSLVSGWIDDRNDRLSAWPGEYGYKETGVEISYSDTQKGDISFWRHGDPILYTDGRYGRRDP